MMQTHPKRQAKILYALKKLGVNYQRCVRCQASEGDPTDLHTVTQTSSSIDVLGDQETRDEQSRTGTWTVGGNRRNMKSAIIVCQRCGFTTQYDLGILEQHI